VVKEKKELSSFNRAKENGLLKINFKDYLEMHLDDNQYADELMIEITSRAFKMPICVYDYGVSGECHRMDFELPKEKTLLVFDKNIEYKFSALGLLKKDKDWNLINSFTNFKYVPKLYYNYNKIILREEEEDDDDDDDDDILEEKKR